MKVILTEAQLYSLLSEEQQIALLAESLARKKNINDLINSIHRALLVGVAAATISAAINRSNLSSYHKKELQEVVQNAETAQQQEQYQQKVNACKRYMEYALGNQGYSLQSTNLSPEALVQAAEKHNFDLPFLIALAHYESCFGANNRAKKTNSVFSVGSYDNGTNAFSYQHPDQSIEPFISLIQRRYLQQGKGLNDLMRPGGFVDVDGRRYSSNKKYEQTLKSIRNRIISMYPVLA